MFAGLGFFEKIFALLFCCFIGYIWGDYFEKSCENF